MREDLSDKKDSSRKKLSRDRSPIERENIDSGKGIDVIREYLICERPNRREKHDR